MVVKSKKDAWRIAELIFPGHFRLDTAASLRAGYSIYSPCDIEELPFENDDEKFKNFEPRICDLGIRLEVVLEDNTVNIWIDDSTPTPADRNKQIVECKQRYGKQISDREVDPFSTSIFFAIGGYYPDMSIGDALKIVDDFRTDYIEQLQAIIDSENKEDK